MGYYVNRVEFKGGSFSSFPKDRLQDINQIFQDKANLLDFNLYLVLIVGSFIRHSVLKDIYSSISSEIYLADRSSYNQCS